MKLSILVVITVSDGLGYTTAVKETYATSSLKYSQYDSEVDNITLTIHRQAHIPKGLSHADHSLISSRSGLLKAVPESTTIVTITMICIV